MINAYLKERGSWIILFFSLQAFLIFIAYIDSALPLDSIVYYVFLSSILFVIFFSFVSKKKRSFTKSFQSEMMFLTYHESLYQPALLKGLPQIALLNTQKD